MVIIFKIPQGEVLKRDCKVSIILAVLVIKSLYFRVLFYRKMQLINWVIKVKTYLCNSNIETLIIS